jgi:hypothetical protein
MAQSRYIEKIDGDTWASVSKEFANWLRERGLAEGFGWSEGDTLVVEGQISLFCLCFPDRHGERISFFEAWAEETGRLYGIKSGAAISFPGNEKLNVTLSPQNNVEVPPWLK